MINSNIETIKSELQFLQKDFINTIEEVLPRIGYELTQLQSKFKRYEGYDEALTKIHGLCSAASIKSGNAGDRVQALYNLWVDAKKEPSLAEASAGRYHSLCGYKDAEILELRTKLKALQTLVDNTGEACAVANNKYAGFASREKELCVKIEDERTNCRLLTQQMEKNDKAHVERLVAQKKQLDKTFDLKVIEIKNIEKLNTDKLKCELAGAQSKIFELERHLAASNITSKEMIRSAITHEQHTEELRTRCRGLELQLDHRNQDYRDMCQHKDEVIKKLRDEIKVAQNKPVSSLTRDEMLDLLTEWAKKS